MTPKVSLIVADDHTLMREGYASMFEGQKGVKIIGEVDNGNDVILMAEQKRPDIILMDIEMPGMDGISAAKIIRNKCPETKIIFVSMHFQYAFYEEFMGLGFNGFLPKDCSFELLMSAIKLTMEEGSSLALTLELLNKKKEYVNLNLKDVFKLSERELEVLELICQGSSTKTISQKLNIAERTVEFHKTNLYQKTNLKTMAELISYGLKLGLGRSNLHK